MVMNALIDEKAASLGLGNLCYSLRPNEKTWVIYNSMFGGYIGALKNMTVYFGISFNDKSEQQIVRILLTVRQHLT